MSSTPRTDPSERADALGGERPVERGSFRDRIRSKPGIGHTWRVGVFLLGLVCILGGFALAVLPGPLTIPPVLLGLWLWSTEFEWAHRFFRPFKKKGEEAWDARQAAPGQLDASSRCSDWCWPASRSGRPATTTSSTAAKTSSGWADPPDGVRRPARRPRRRHPGPRLGGRHVARG